MQTIPKVTPQARAAETSDLGAKLVYAGKQADVNEGDPFRSMLAELEGINNKAVIALKKDKAESDLDDFDSSRDATYRSLLYLCKGFTHHPDQVVQTAALALEEVMDKYGFDLPETSYSSESALMESLLTDLDQAELTQKAELLPGFTALKEKLREEQSGFKAAEYSYLQARKQDQSGPTVSELKKDILALINGKLVVYLNGMLAANSAQHIDLASQLRMLITELNSIVKQRKSKNK